MFSSAHKKNIHMEDQNLHWLSFKEKKENFNQKWAQKTDL